jgi:cell division protease FtsH
VNPKRGRPQDSNPERDADQQQAPKSPLLNFGPRIIWFILLLALAGWVWQSIYQSPSSPVQISYTEFRTQVLADNVSSVTITGNQVQGDLNKAANTTDSAGNKQSYQQFTTYVPSFGDRNLLPTLESHSVDVTVQPDNGIALLPLLINYLPIVLLGVLLVIYFRRMQSQGQGLFSMGQSRAKLYDRRKERTTFNDVAGAEGAKTELMEVIDFLKDPDRFHTLGGTIPKGVLLVGSPGTGKTLLARAVAGEADVPFFSITGSDFMEMFVGVGASRVRDLFKEAKKVSPCIIFIDELDSIGRRRGAGLGGGHDEREQTLNQLLSEMDGFEPTQSVIVMAATNRPDILDPALLRPGRFDRRITVDLPTLKDRVEIIKIHSRNKPLAPDVDIESIARGTPGFSGADLENLMNEAALLAARKDKQSIGQADVEEARDKVLMGLERRNLALTSDETRMIAYHEGGHALLAVYLPNTDPIHKVTIVPRGRAMGVTQQLPEREKYLYPREYMLDRLAVMMGGRAAEDLVYQTATSGAENDLKQATKLARKMVLDWGMSKRLGHVALGSENQEVFLGEELGHRREYSEDTARDVDEEVKNILDEAFNRARSVLAEHRDGLDKLADSLVQHEELTGQEVIRLLGAPAPEQDGRSGSKQREEAVEGQE